MSRDYYINGECMVYVLGASGSPIAGTQAGTGTAMVQLGLTDRNGRVKISPKYVHRDVLIDDFGPDVPAEVLWKLAEVAITMTLVHFDQSILNACLAESAGGGTAGTFVGAGTPLGGGAPLYSSTCHYVSLNLTSPVLGQPWQFPTSYLAGQPIELPLGVERSPVVCTWRAIPYQPLVVTDNQPQEIVSKGAKIWTRQLAGVAA